MADNDCGTIPVQMIELHRVFDRQHDCSRDLFTKFEFSCQTLFCISIKLKSQSDKLLLEI